MRWSLLLLPLACGPIYPQQQAAPSSSSQQPQAGPPGGGGDPWANQAPANQPPSAGRPDDPYSASAPSDPYGDPNAGPPNAGPPNPTPDSDPYASRPAPRPRQPPPPPPPPRPAPGGAGGKLARDAQLLLDAHNAVRTQHCAAPLTWSPKLEAAARDWANHLRDSGCKFGHSGGRYGENLAAGTTGTLDGQSVTSMWYDEVRQYDFRSGGFSMQTGHFTQVVWRATTQLGCAMSQCNGNDIWVCEYDPPGNVETQYRANVLPKGCQ